MSAPAAEELVALAARLGELLLARHWRLATAESSTGGQIGQVITANPGASAYYLGGVIAYSNQAKEVELGVPHDALLEHGAVSAPVAAAMAVGAAHRFATEVGLSVTGIAGPEGGTPAKPVGLHLAGLAVRGQAPRVEERIFIYDRDGNRSAATQLALQLALDELERLPAAG